MVVALVLVSLLCLVQMGFIVALLNRLLVQAKIPPIGLPQRKPETPPEPTRRKAFTMPIEG